MFMLLYSYIWGDYMRVRFDEKSTKSIVEGYYKKYEDFECSLEIRSDVKETKHPSRSLPPVKFADISFVLNGTLSVDGNNIAVSVPVSFEEIKGVFRTTLETNGYNVKDIEINYISDLAVSESGFRYVDVEISSKWKIK